MLGDQFRSGFRADTGDTGHIIGAVANQGEAVEQPVGAHLIFIFHPGRIHHPVIHRVPHSDFFIHQLQQVLVPGDDDHLVTPAAKSQGCGADDVIGLDSSLFKTYQAHGLHHFLYIGQLGRKFIGHRRTVGLVLGVHLMPEHFAPAVESDGQMRGSLILQQFIEHTDEAKHRIGLEPFRIGQWCNGVKGPVNEGTAVN